MGSAWNYWYVGDVVVHKTPNNFATEGTEYRFASLMLVPKCGNWVLVVSRLKLDANHACWLRDAHCGVRLQLDEEENNPSRAKGHRRARRVFFKKTVSEKKKRISGIARRS